MNCYQSDVIHVRIESDFTGVLKMLVNGNPPQLFLCKKEGEQSQKNQTHVYILWSIN